MRSTGRSDRRGSQRAAQQTGSSDGGRPGSIGLSEHTGYPAGRYSVASVPSWYLTRRCWCHGPPDCSTSRWMCATKARARRSATWWMRWRTGVGVCSPKSLPVHRRRLVRSSGSAARGEVPDAGARGPSSASPLAGEDRRLARSRSNPCGCARNRASERARGAYGADQASSSHLLWPMHQGNAACPWIDRPGIQAQRCNLIGTQPCQVDQGQR